MVFVAAVAYAADDGSYRPDQYNNGQYRPYNDGKYYPSAVPVRPFVRAFVPTVPVYQPVYRFQPYARYQPASPEGYSQTLRDVRSQSPNGDYAYEYETQNGIVASEQSQVVQPNVQRKTGFYQYPSPDGRIIRVDYVADENGFHASGAHLPQSPPIPAAIARSIEYNLRHAKPQ